MESVPMTASVLPFSLMRARRMSGSSVIAEAVYTGAVVATVALESGLALGVARDAETVDATMIAPPRPTATSRATRTIRRFAGGSSDLLTAQHVTRRPSAMRASGLH